MNHSHDHRHHVSWPECIVLTLLVIVAGMTALFVREGMKAEPACTAIDEDFVEADSGFVLCRSTDGSIVRRPFP